MSHTRAYFRRNMTEQAEHPLLEPFSKWGIDGTMTEQDGTNRDSLSETEINLYRGVFFREGDDFSLSVFKCLPRGCPDAHALAKSNVAKAK